MNSYKLVFIQFVALLVLSVLPGCASLPRNVEKTHSLALLVPHENTISRFYQDGLEAHPGMSGLRVLEDNPGALLIRGILAKNAEKTLDLQYYIFKDDEVAGLVQSWVLEAADRGVRVRILVDDLGTTGKDAKLAVLAKHANISVRVFNPLAQRDGLRTDLLFVAKAERRMHNKAFIVDNVVAVIGGRNIGNEYFTAPGDLVFSDLDVMTVGPVVREISSSFDAFWNSEWSYPVGSLFNRKAGQAEMEALREESSALEKQLLDSPYRQAVLGSSVYEQLSKLDFQLFWVNCSLLYDAPEKIGSELDAVNPVFEKYKTLFASAESEFTMVTPYFTPGKGGVAFFQMMRKRGVSIRVMTNSLATNDVWLVHSGYAPYRRALLESGVELFELKLTAFKDVRKEIRQYVNIKEIRLHIKALVIDRRYVVLGSSNFDPRSLVYNTEVGLVVDSPELAHYLLKGFGRLTSPQNSYRLYLENVRGDDGVVRKRTRWAAEEDGVPVVLESDPGAGFWRSFGAWFMQAFPIEGKL